MQSIQNKSFSLVRRCQVIENNDQFLQRIDTAKVAVKGEALEAAPGLLSVLS
jgi:hypothetical protein